MEVSYISGKLALEGVAELGELNAIREDIYLKSIY